MLHAPPIVRGLLLTLLLVGASPAPDTSVEVTSREPTNTYAATLIQQSKNIVLVRVHSLKVHGSAREYKGKVIETLKGNVGGSVVVRMPWNGFPSADNLEADFAKMRGGVGYGHTEIAFWLGAAGRSVTLEAAGFGLGDYLLFLDQLHHRYGAELISGSDDAWYGAVKKMVFDTGVSGLTVDPIVFLKMFGSVYLAKCGEPQPANYAIGKVWGKDYKLEGWRATLRDDHPPGWLDPDFDERREPCTVRRGRSFYYLALFVDDYTQFPIAVPVEDGVVRFDLRYGNIALTKRNIQLQMIIRGLADNTR